MYFNTVFMLFSFHCSGFDLTRLEDLECRMSALGFEVLLLSESCCFVFEDREESDDSDFARLLRAFVSVGYPSEFTTLIQRVDRYLLSTSFKVVEWLRSHGITEAEDVIEVESLESALDSVVSDLSAAVDSGDLSELPVPTLRGGEA